MIKGSLKIPFYMPDKIYRALKILKKGLLPGRERDVNLIGDRDVEWSWVSSEMPAGPGRALDVGSGNTNLALLAARKGFDVTAIDMEPVICPYVHHRLRFIRGDILKYDLPKDYFDVVITCSTVEHIGISGRYGVREDRPDGDLETMRRLKELMKPGGEMLVTMPVGLDGVFKPFCRVYGDERLPRLLSGYNVKKEEFWAKEGPDNSWRTCDKKKALAFKPYVDSNSPLRIIYALGCFVLIKP